MGGTVLGRFTVKKSDFYHEDSVKGGFIKIALFSMLLYSAIVM